MIGWFGRKDKTKQQTPPLERGPIGVGIGGAIDMDLLSLEADALGGNPSMALPRSGPFLVAGYGEARLEHSSVLSRYYDDDNRMIQVMTASGRAGDAIEDVTFYQPWDSVVPSGVSEWNRWTGPQGLIGQPHYDADGIRFERFWGEGSGRMQPVEFVETVEDGEQRRTIHQTCMLYFRPLGQMREMLLINVERDIDQGAGPTSASIEFMLGYGLKPADLRRV